MGSIMKGVRGLLWVCTLVYVCHAVQIGHTSVNVPDVENVATANGASVRVQEDGACGAGQTVLNPQDDHEFKCLSKCPRMADEDYTTTTLLHGNLAVGQTCGAKTDCEKTIEVELGEKQTFTFSVKPMNAGATSRYVLRVDAISVEVRGTAMSLRYDGVLEGTFNLTLEQWSHVAIATEMDAMAGTGSEWLVLLYVYVDGVYMGGASGRSAEKATGTSDARLGQCGVVVEGCGNEDTTGPADVMLRDVMLKSTLLSSRQVMALFSGSLPAKQPHPECVCPIKYPVAVDDMTCKSDFRVGLMSRFQGGEGEYYLAADLLLHPVTTDAFYHTGNPNMENRNIPLFFATAPDDDDVTITIDIPYSQVQTISISSVTKYPETAIYVTGYSKFESTSAVLKRSLAADCDASMIDNNYTPCTDIGSVAPSQGIFTYMLNFTAEPRALTSFDIRYQGLPSWTGGEVNNVAAKKAHLITNVMVMGKRKPYITQLTPRYGPQAGGTLLTLQGVHLDLSTPTVMVGDQPCTVNEYSSSAITCTTQPMNATTTRIGEPLGVRTSFAAGETLSMGTFSYRTNPIITAASRLKTFAAAGLSLDVNGTDLQSVSKPYLLTTAKYKGSDYPQMNTMCRVHSNTHMSCPYPELNTTGMSIAWPDNDQPGLMYHLGLALDGVDTYKDGIMVGTMNYSMAEVYASPQVNSFDNTPHKFKVWNTKEILIEGKQLLSGCDEEDYMVMVGDKMCVITEMTASKITCQPPNKTPQMSMEADIYHELPQCVVMQGSRRTTVGWVLYERTLWDDVSLRVAILAIVFAIVMVIFVAVLVYFDNKKKKKARDHFDVLISNNIGHETGIKVHAHQIEPERLHIVGDLIIRVDESKLAYGTYEHEEPKFVQKVLVKKFQLTQFASEKYHVKELIHFLKSATSMAGLTEPSIHQLIGVARIENGAYAVYMHAQNYNLRHHLRQQNVALTVGDMARMCSELASALNYLSASGIVHGDVAARNCLIDVHGGALLGDNAMSRKLNPDEYSDIRGFDKPVPVRWMAPEYLRGTLPTSESDAWSYGVMCWEIMTRGRWPYENLYLDDVISLVFKGGHLVQPRQCPNEIFEMLVLCWRSEPSDRVNFKDIDGYLTSVIRQAEVSENRRESTVEGTTFDPPNIASSQLYEQLVAPPPENYELRFSKLVGKYNQGFLAATEESTKV